MAMDEKMRGVRKYGVETAVRAMMATTNPSSSSDGP